MANDSLTVPARWLYLDNLRAFAMLAGVLFHAGLAYSPLAQAFFSTADRQNAAGMDVWLWFLHLFRMPLFFLLSGLVCAALIERRGMGGFLLNRGKRIVLPFLLFWPLVYLALKHSTEWAALNALHPSPLLQFIKPYLQSTQAMAVPPSTSHLWFLYYLGIFCLLTWSGRVLGVGKLLDWFMDRGPIWHLSVFPLLLVPMLFTVSAPHPAPESFFPQFWALGFYGAFFAYGFGLHGRTPPEQAAGRSPVLLFLVACLLYALFLYLLQQQVQGMQAGKGSVKSLHAAIAVLEAYLSVWMTLLCLVFGKAFLDRSSRLLRFLSDASYWTYIVHLPLLFLIQYRLMDLDWAWPLKFAASVILCLALCLLSYRWLIRPTVLDRLLGGGSRSASAAQST